MASPAGHSVSAAPDSRHWRAVSPIVSTLAARSGSFDESLKAFEAVQTESDDSVLNDRSAILEEFSTLKGLIQHEKLTHRFVDLFKSPGMRKRCFLGFLVMFGCQGTGTLVINSILYPTEQKRK